RGRLYRGRSGCANRRPLASERPCCSQSARGRQRLRRGVCQGTRSGLRPCGSAAYCGASVDMSYLVLARKWRPMSFSDLVGQEHVSRTLASAIASGRIAHAFLFTGVRGVGKTTSARILAKALNCMGDPDAPAGSPDPGPTVEPCLKCAACKEIALGTDMDVREIDGASYNGVDEVRKLQDS